jgi:acetylglutamate kinase
MRWIFRSRWNLIQPKRNHPTIDYGFVGDVKSVNAPAVTNFAFGITPVFCAITHDKTANLNTNADTIASELAIALSAVLSNFELLFEKSGVLRIPKMILCNCNYECRLIFEIKSEKRSIPNDSKLDNCFNSLSRGVQKNTNNHSMLQNDDAICNIELCKMICNKLIVNLCNVLKK